MAIRFLYVTGLVIIIGFLCVGIFNWFINPYSIYSGPSIEGINKDKFGFVNYLRLTKTYQVANQKPSAIILGTSRSGRGLDPEHRGWDNNITYNLALPNASMFEILRYFQHANSVQPLQKIVLGIEYRCFTNNFTSSGFSDSRLLIKEDGNNNNKYLEGLLSDIAATLISTNSLFTSLGNLRRQGWTKDTLFENGRWDRITEEQWDYRQAFNAYLKDTVERIGGELTSNGYSSTEFKAYRTFLKTAYSQNIKVYLAISPSHALHWEIYRIFGLWDKFEELKRNLVKINEEEAKNAGKPPYPLWDFSGYNSINIEDIPPNNDTNTHMQWFWESVHYKKRLGDIVLNKLFGLLQEEAINEDFGFKLSSINMEKHFQQQRAAQQRYVSSHVVDIKEIKKLADNFLIRRSYKF